MQEPGLNFKHGCKQLVTFGEDNYYWPVGCSSMAQDQIFQHPQAPACLQPCEASSTHLTVAKHMLQRRRKQTALLIKASFTMTNKRVVHILGHVQLSIPNSKPNSPRQTGEVRRCRLVSAGVCDLQN